jgi:hypothetical protein
MAPVKKCSPLKLNATFIQEHNQHNDIILHSGSNDFCQNENWIHFDEVMHFEGTWPA